MGRGPGESCGEDGRVRMERGRNRRRERGKMGRRWGSLLLL